MNSNNTFKNKIINKLFAYKYIYIYIYNLATIIEGDPKAPFLIPTIGITVRVFTKTSVQSQVESYQRLKKWYLMPP